MKINKAQWQTEGDNVRLSMPLTKVDKENRLVSGWASLDNHDTQGDVVMAEANTKAFARFRGNIREMHQPIAVGKMVAFREDSYYDTETEKFYNGIFVDVYVSKGAQDTWEKVLDGTLQGFSIGGSILEAEEEFDKAAGKKVRFVKDYELVELSLVDSPANQLANILSVHKTATGTFMDGAVAAQKSESVFYCKADEVAKTSNEESATCVNGHKMESIGWIEYEDDDAKAEKVKEVVAKYNHEETAEQELPATTEGGVDVADEKDNKEEVVDPGTTSPVVDPVGEEGKAASEVEEVSAPEEKEVEKAADVSEVEVEDPDFAEAIGNLQKVIEAGLTKTREEVKDDLAKATQAFEEKVTALETQHQELTTKFDSLKSNLDSVEKSLQAVEAETAVKKSGDFGEKPEETLSKSKGSSKWGGRFLGISTLEED